MGIISFLSLLGPMISSSLVFYSLLFTVNLSPPLPKGSKQRAVPMK